MSLLPDRFRAPGASPGEFAPRPRRTGGLGLDPEDPRHGQKLAMLLDLLRANLALREYRRPRESAA